MSSPVRFLAISLAALVAASCTAAGGGPTSGPASGPTGSPGATGATGIAYPTGANDLVLRLRYVGGFIGPATRFLELPAISVYGDGTVVVPGPQIAIYPGPALPNLQRATITPAGMQTLLEAARAAGLLGPDATYDLGGVMDGSTAEFTLNADGRIHTMSAYALLEGQGAPQGTDAAVAEARAKLALFQGQLRSLEALLDTEIGPWSSYQAEAVRLLVSQGAPTNEQGLAQEPVVWPLSTPLATFGETLPAPVQGQRCGVVSGSDLDTLMPLLQQANTLTPWTDDGASFGIAVRPLLPAEEGCPPPAA